MPTIHFLNVKDGDCSIVQHYSGRVSVIDVSNAEPQPTTVESRIVDGAFMESASKGVFGNFSQKKYPVNPVVYLQDRNIISVFRFVLTHPDMDHMDGIKVFFETFRPGNLWDTDNEEEKEFEEGSRYDEDDWKFYKKLRDGKPTEDPRRLTLFSGSTGQYWNQDENGQGSGDGIRILAPTPDLVRAANETGDYNDASYVILYKTDDHRIVFSGDSHDRTWDHILSVHEVSVTDVDLLIAPHHGRESRRSYEFLKVLNPKLTFFGNARSEHLAYDAWNNRNLPFITNNQAGCMIVHTDDSSMKLYVTHKPFAERINPSTYYDKSLKAYYCADF